jgi:hypothetical protein
MSTGLLEMLQSYALNPSAPYRLTREAVSMAITLTMTYLAEASFWLLCPRSLVVHASVFRLFSALLQCTMVFLQNFRARHSISRASFFSSCSSICAVVCRAPTDPIFLIPLLLPLRGNDFVGIRVEEQQ